MYQREVLGLDEARAAVEAIIAEASKEPERPIAVAVVDDRGDPVYLARMDRSFSLFADMSMNKAYTAARFRRDTLEFAERQRRSNKTLAGFGDSKITDQAGGLCIKKPDGTSLGGIGVSGRSGDENVALASVGLKAMNL